MRITGGQVQRCSSQIDCSVFAKIDGGFFWMLIPAKFRQMFTKIRLKSEKTMKFTTNQISQILRKNHPKVRKAFFFLVRKTVDEKF